MTFHFCIVLYTMYVQKRTCLNLNVRVQQHFIYRYMYKIVYVWVNL